MREVAACPSVRTLMDLKDCLDFCSTSWVQLFCRLGGAALLLQVLFAAYLLQMRPDAFDG